MVFAQQRDISRCWAKAISFQHCLSRAAKGQSFICQTIDVLNLRPFSNGRKFDPLILAQCKQHSGRSRLSWWNEVDSVHKNSVTSRSIKKKKKNYKVKKNTNLLYLYKKTKTRSHISCRFAVKRSTRMELLRHVHGVTTCLGEPVFI